MPRVSTAETIVRERKKSLREIFEEARAEGYSIAELAANLGVSAYTTRAYLKDHGYEAIRGFRRKRV